MNTRLEAQCRARGMRWTAQRRVIAEVISKSTDHPDVNELHRRVLEHDKRVSLATVYRTVRRFEREGIIERCAFGDGRARYERPSSRHHDHLIDIQTGKVVEFTSPEIEQLQTKIVERLGYALVGHRLELYGVSTKTKRSHPKS
jgi:Fur family ferric uptake transcriptional regulator